MAYVIQTKQMGTFWAACCVSLGISCLGHTESDARNGVENAIKTRK